MSADARGGPRPTLPLGIDFGRSRIRVALCARAANGRPTLIAVAARAHGGDPERALREAVHELGTAERRCVLGIGAPDALLRVISLPAMSRFERGRAAVFQAARYIDYPVADAAISLVPLTGDARWTLGIARRVAIEARVAAAKRAKLVPLAIDDVAFALRRAHGDADGTIDISDDVTRLTIFAQPIPFVADVALGAMLFTEGIARALGIDADAAEERKRTIGFAGAGEAQRDAVIDAIADMLARARAAGHTEIRRLAMIGNGSRVPGLPEAIERATGYGVRLAALDVGVSDVLPADVLRAAGADWSVAYGLSLWDAAA
jgi:Tfp pilus assembly PilM family ATPase